MLLLHSYRLVRLHRQRTTRKNTHGKQTKKRDPVIIIEGGLQAAIRQLLDWTEVASYICCGKGLLDLSRIEGGNGPVAPLKIPALDSIIFTRTEV